MRTLIFAGGWKRFFSVSTCSEKLRTFGRASSVIAERGTAFGVGFAPQGWDHLMRHLRGRGFTEPELIASGLVSQGNRGVYDRFRGRLMWPIRDVTGQKILDERYARMLADLGPDRFFVFEDPDEVSAVLAHMKLLSTES